MTIIQKNADHIPNEFKNIGKKQVNNLLVLSAVLNWDHMRDISNLVCHFLCLIKYSVTFVVLSFKFVY